MDKKAFRKRDICTKFITPALVQAGWDIQTQIREEVTFIDHHKKKYGLPLPIWIASEVWDFGTLSHLFGGMREKEQDAIAERYGICNGCVFASWLRSLNYLRNVCAYHSRLWNRNMTDQPRKPANDEAILFFPRLAESLRSGASFPAVLYSSVPINDD